MIKYRILIEKNGDHLEKQYTADDGRMLLAEMSLEELEILDKMCDDVKNDINKYKSLK